MFCDCQTSILTRTTTSTTITIVRVPEVHSLARFRVPIRVRILIHARTRRRTPTIHHSRIPTTRLSQFPLQSVPTPACSQATNASARCHLPHLPLSKSAAILPATVSKPEACATALALCSRPRTPIPLRTPTPRSGPTTRSHWIPAPEAVSSRSDREFTDFALLFVTLYTSFVLV